MSAETLDSTMVGSVEVTTVARIAYELTCVACGEQIAEIEDRDCVDDLATGHTCDLPTRGVCPDCGQTVHLTESGHLCVHIVPRDVHPDRICTGDRPALARRLSTRRP